MICVLILLFGLLRKEIHKIMFIYVSVVLVSTLMFPDRSNNKIETLVFDKKTILSPQTLRAKDFYI